MASNTYVPKLKVFFLFLLFLSLFLQVFTNINQFKIQPVQINPLGDEKLEVLSDQVILHEEEEQSRILNVWSPVNESMTSPVLPLDQLVQQRRQQQQQSLIQGVTSNESITSPVHSPRKYSSIFKFFAKEFKEEVIKIGLVNIGGEEEEWKSFGSTTSVQFDQVPQEWQWEDLMLEWINEERWCWDNLHVILKTHICSNRWPLPKCPKLSMPRFEEYKEFDVIVTRVPCGNGAQGEGVRDVFRLQVNLIVANLVVRSRRHDDGHPIYVVFIGSCGPMWEIFRCDDLLKHEGEVWIYRPDFRRLRQKVLLPVGTCRLALPYVKLGDGNIKYKFDRFGKTIDHPREAYVTMLHSSEEYVCGAIALAQSIIRTNSTKDRILLADESITKRSRQALRAAGWRIKLINRIRNPHAEKDSYNEWNYSKLRLWQLTQYDKVIFIDSDLIILKNIDGFFMSSQLSAATNDKVLFNSGVMLIEPSECTFEMLMQKTQSLVSYNGGDQGFLNEAFTWWHRWPKKSNFLKIFNVNDTQHEVPDSVYAIHYLGLKPWMCYRDYDCNWDLLDHRPYASDSAHRKWWQVHDSMSKKLQKSCSLSKVADARISEQRGFAKNARLSDGHWKIKVKDTRQHHLV